MTAQICRLCLSHSTNHIYVVNNSELVDKIRECVSIEILTTEYYSKFVCSECLTKVENWYNFKSMCLNTKKVLETQTKRNNLCGSILKPEDDANKEVISRNACGTVWNNTGLCMDRSQLNNDCASQSDQNSLLDSVLQHTCDNQPDTYFVYSKNNSNRKNDAEVKSELFQTEDSYSCEHCFAIFNYYTDYLDHQILHNGNPVFYCEKCSVKFSSKQELVKHEKEHKIPCDICGTKVLRQSMKIHLNKHTDRFKCNECSMKFTSRTMLAEHVASRHLKLKHYCDTCGKEYATRSSLTLHLKIHSDEKGYKCDQCDYAGKTRMALRIHVSKHENGTYICEYCSKIFKSNRNLRDHVTRVHKCNKKYACDVCGMRFSLRYLVRKHKRTHTGDHPYHCPKCLRTFARSDSLKEHMQTHDRTGTYNCDRCLKIFKTKRGMKRHNCIKSETSCNESKMLIT